MQRIIRAHAERVEEFYGAKNAGSDVASRTEVWGNLGGLPSDGAWSGEAFSGAPPNRPVSNKSIPRPPLGMRRQRVDVNHPGSIISNARTAVVRKNLDGLQSAHAAIGLRRYLVRRELAPRRRDDHHESDGRW
jgi:hypothetical protein